MTSGSAPIGSRLPGSDPAFRFRFRFRRRTGWRTPLSRPRRKFSVPLPNPMFFRYGNGNSPERRAFSGWSQKGNPRRFLHFAFETVFRRNENGPPLRRERRERPGTLPQRPGFHNASAENAPTNPENGKSLSGRRFGASERGISPHGRILHDLRQFGFHELG